MYRQSPRNPRSKRFRVKNVLQISLLLAVCFWLIYQVKHSHDKKKEFDETDGKASLERTNNDELIKLGRKDIRPRVDETNSKNEVLDEQSEEEETIEEVDEIKPEEKKVEEKEDEDEEEHEQEKSDAEIDGEQGVVDGEEREDGEESETQETNSEDGNDQKEKGSTVDDADHDADDRAREEHYKADDASSAVTHDTETVTENDNEHLENSNEHSGNTVEEEKKDNNSEGRYESEERKDLEVEGSEAARDGHQSNATTSQDTTHDTEIGSIPNDEVTEGSNDHLMSNNTAKVTLENNDLPSSNSTESRPEFLDQEQANNSTLNVDSSHSHSNSTDAVKIEDAGSLSEEFSDSSNSSTDSSAFEDSRLDSFNEEGDTTESSQKSNEFEGEKSGTSDEKDETLETGNTEEVQEDAIDVSDSVEEKDVRTDLETLPEIQTEGTNSEGVAAE